jgi:tripeptide aminopeptidase
LNRFRIDHCPGSERDIAPGGARRRADGSIQERGAEPMKKTAFITAITAAYRKAFTQAAREVVNDKGKHARVKFRTHRNYFPYRLKENSKVVQSVQEVASKLGWQTTLKVSNGGLDANWLARHGIPTLTFGAGQHDVHTTDEFVDLAEYLDGCKLALALSAKC